MKATRILRDCPKELLDRYDNREITSIELGRILNVNPVSVRRAIHRSPRPPAQKEDLLRLARDKYRKSVAHLSTIEIMRLAYVSKSTAIRIKAKYA